MKKSKLLLVSLILSGLYPVYIVGYFFNGLDTTKGSEQAGMALALTLVVPYIVALAIGLLFNVLGYAMSRRGFALTGAILYTVAIVLFPLYFMFVIIQVILSFVGFAKMQSHSTVAIA